MRQRQRIIRRKIRNLGFDPTPSQIKSIDRAWQKRTWWIQFVTFVGFLLPVGIGWILLNSNMLRGGGSITRVFINIFIYISLPVMIFTLTQGWIVSALGRKRFYPVLREHGFDICSSCGYRLTGDDRETIDLDCCPECGMQFNRMKPLMRSASVQNQDRETSIHSELTPS